MVTVLIIVLILATVLVIQSRVRSKSKVGMTGMVVSEYDCNYNDQQGKSSVLPCNKQIALFSGIFNETEMGVNITQIIKGNLTKLADLLGYELSVFEAHSEEDLFYNDLIEELHNSTAQIMVLKFHGSSEGYIGPVACIPNTTSAKDAWWNAYESYFDYDLGDCEDKYECDGSPIRFIDFKPPTLHVIFLVLVLQATFQFLLNLEL